MPGLDEGVREISRGDHRLEMMDRFTVRKGRVWERGF